MELGFDSNKYLQIQSKEILERANKFHNKLYLEFGGKIFDDFHAARVLPGFKPNAKIELLKTLGDKCEIVLSICATDIETNRIQSDYGITYSENLIRIIQKLRDHNLHIEHAAITKYTGQSAANNFKRRLKKLGVHASFLNNIENYPRDIPHILSDKGFGKNDFIQTTRPIVVVAGSGSSSGKMATCLSQLYHESKSMVSAGFAKFEKFPVWNLPLNHPINLAYEAATTNIDDKNMIDPFHLEAYGVSAVNYNRDVDAFPILAAMFSHIWGSSIYLSPTDMGVNTFKLCITNEDICIQAANQEIVRRYFKTICDESLYGGKKHEIEKIELLMNIAKITIDIRTVVKCAREKALKSKTNSTAIELPSGQIVVGRDTDLLSSSSSALLNALKVLANIPDNIRLIPPQSIEPIQRLNTEFLKSKETKLHPNEILIALSTNAAIDHVAQGVLEQLPNLKNSEAHATTLLNQSDINLFSKLGINITCEP